MKKNRILTVFFTGAILLAFGGYAANKIERFFAEKSKMPEYAGSVFSDLWNTVVKEKYTTLPTYKLSEAAVGDMLRKMAHRTLKKRNDLFPEPYEKVAHPNGICMKGTWKIKETNKNNPYTGYFKNGKKAVMISRISVAMSNPKKGMDFFRTRGFGHAGKLFPTDDPNYTDKLHTANFFTLDSIGGTNADHATDVSPTNAPVFTLWDVTFETIKLGLDGYGTRLIEEFSAEDINGAYRDVYEIAELGLSPGDWVIYPKFMRLTPLAGEWEKPDDEDFRDELDLSKNYGGKLEFAISVANEHDRDDSGELSWTELGTILYTDSVRSLNCDQRLHFAHPQLRDHENDGLGYLAYRKQQL